LRGFALIQCLLPLRNTDADLSPLTEFFCCALQQGAPDCLRGFDHGPTIQRSDEATQVGRHINRNKGKPMRTSFKNLASVAAVLFALSATPAAAQEAEESSGPITISGSITAVSDYRFRGYSLSDFDPAIQPTININHESGFYVGVWASNLADTPTYDKAELDLYAGFTKEIASGTTIDAAVLYYYYPRGSGASDYFEPYVSLSHAIGPVTAKGGVHWAPSQAATGNTDLLYLYGQLAYAIPETPVTITGKVGNQDLGASSYWDWSLGASVTADKLTFGLTYVDADTRSVFAPGDAKAGVFLSVGYAF
jgi:uncharacterized protein (TIGR02001 family)